MTNLASDRILRSRVWERMSSTVTFDHPVTGQRASLSAIDKTTGVELFDGSIGAPTIRAAIWLRTQDMLSAGIAPTSMFGSVVSLNSKDWRVEVVVPKPAIGGEDVGITQLIVSALNDR